jgi:hypothetical protein
MPASVFWRMVSYANRFVDDHRAEAAELSSDGSFETIRTQSPAPLNIRR